MAKKLPADERLLTPTACLRPQGGLSAADFSSTLDLCCRGSEHTIDDSGSCIFGQERALQALQIGLADLSKAKPYSPLRHIYVSGASACGKRSLTAFVINSLNKVRTETVVSASSIPDLVIVPDFNNSTRPRCLQLPAGSARQAQLDIDALLLELQNYFQLLAAKHTTVSDLYLSGKAEALQYLDELDCRQEPILPGPLQVYWRQVSQHLSLHLSELLLSLREQATPQYVEGYSPFLHHYRINVFSASTAPNASYTCWSRACDMDYETTGARPVVYVHELNYSTLWGSTLPNAPEQPYPDHTRLVPGAWHRAFGGFLVLNAESIIGNLEAWSELKQVLRQGYHEYCSPLRPEGLPGPHFSELRLPAQVKVILIGSPGLHQKLAESDPDFLRIFPLKADFDDEFERNHDSELALARWAASFVQNRHLTHLSTDAVNCLIEYSCRLAEDQGKLSLQFRELIALLIESHSLFLDALLKSPTFPENIPLAERKEFIEQHPEQFVISRQHLEEALRCQQYRSSLVEEHLQAMTSENVIRIDTSGDVVGQINGLTVIDTGDYEFGRPVRITARYSLNKEGLTDIERDSELGGKIHSKGLMILNGYICARFAQKNQWPISITMAVEQNYDEIEGDSASSAEAYALLSSLANLPIKQGIAVTGAIDQFGNVQAIGGVNEKIEGFFATCLKRKLTKRQGVIIPAANLPHLVLAEKVCQAIRQGKFSIWAVSHLDEGIEILTGTPAGKMREGRYPKQSVYGLIQANLEELTADSRDSTDIR